MSTGYKLADEARSGESRSADARSNDSARRRPDASTAAASRAAAMIDASPAAEEQDDTDLGLFPRRIKSSEIVYITSQLAIMSETGINLSSALTALADQEQNPSLKAVLTRLRLSVESGEDFSTALSRHPKVFDATYVALVRASESTGALAEMLDRIATYLRKDLDTRGTVRSAMAYPGVMFLLAISVCVFLLTWVFPKFTPIFVRKGLKLPLPTVVVMAISDALTNYWYLWIAALALLIAGLIFGKSHPQGRQILDWIKINVPILGPLMRKVVLSRGIRTLGTMLASGVPTLDALRLCGEVSGNVYYRALWDDVIERVTSGNQICAALSGTTLLPPTLVQMIATGEDTGKLDLVLSRVSVYYDKEVENAVKAATSLIEPILITVMGGIVGTIALALLMPIFTLSRNAG